MVTSIREVLFRPVPVCSCLLVCQQDKRKKNPLAFGGEKGKDPGISFSNILRYRFLRQLRVISEGIIHRLV